MEFIPPTIGLPASLPPAQFIFSSLEVPQAYRTEHIHTDWTASQHRDAHPTPVTTSLALAEATALAIAAADTIPSNHIRNRSLTNILAGPPTSVLCTNDNGRGGII